MVSGQSVVVGLFIAAVGSPLLLFPRRSARIRHRHASDPEPTDAAVTEARLGGALIVLTGLLVLVFG